MNEIKLQSHPQDEDTAIRHHHPQFLVSLPWCSQTQTIHWYKTTIPTYQNLLDCIMFEQKNTSTTSTTLLTTTTHAQQQKIRRAGYFVHQGVARAHDALVLTHGDDDSFLTLRLRLRGGMDRQNRVGSKFGGGGVSSAQQSERERKERLKQLALESIDLAKDPYFVRNHLGSYECKLCLTLHRDEANYLAHTQGKKHQQGLGRRAHLEKLKEQQEKQQQDGSSSTVLSTSQTTVMRPKLRIGRPAYQVFKSRDADTHQRCLSFELHYPDLGEEWQPRHRFMSAFEQRVDRPPDRRYQYLLFAAGDYETVAFRVPNEPMDKDHEKFVTHWDAESKKFTLTLHFMETSSS